MRTDAQPSSNRQFRRDANGDLEAVVKPRKFTVTVEFDGEKFSSSVEVSPEVDMRSRKMFAEAANVTFERVYKQARCRHGS